MRKTKQFLKIVNKFENTGEGFFQRNGADAVIWCRQTATSDLENNMWPNARRISDSLSKAGILNFGPEIDQHAGMLFIRVKGVYNDKETN